MERLILTFAFPFQENTEGAWLVRTLRRACEVRGLVGEPAKMGPHATIIPPFYCTEKEKRLLAALSRHTWKLVSTLNTLQLRVPIEGLNVFEPPVPGSDKGALYIALKMNEEYREFVERHKLDWPLEYFHPPIRSNAVERAWIPHIHVIEGQNLHKTAPRHFPEMREYLYGRTITLGEPLFFEKKEQGGQTYWSQVQA